MVVKVQWDQVWKVPGMQLGLNKWKLTRQKSRESLRGIPRTGFNVAPTATSALTEVLGITQQ